MLDQICAAALTMAAPVASCASAVPADQAPPAVFSDAQQAEAPPEDPVAPDAARTAPPDAPAQSGPNTIVVTGSMRRIDPLQGVNAASFDAAQAIDKAALGPAAHAYEHVVPAPVRSGLHHFLVNLHEPVVAANFLLQLKPGKAAATLARFAINSTVGIGGLLDVAAKRPFKLRHRDNGFADTLGFYGVKPGPFLFLPLIGPTTVRDLFGFSIDRLAAPLSVGHFVAPLRQSTFTAPAAVMTALDKRVEADPQASEVRQADSPYARMRLLYLTRRQAEIDDLRHPVHSHPAPGLQAPETPAPRN